MAFYAVKKGRKPGVYNSWDECSEQINGFSGAIYKKFKFEADAQAFISSDAISSVKTLNATEGQNNISDVPANETVSLYTDGACSGNPGPGGFGYAVVINDVLVQKGSGGLISTTNNQMELGAVIEGLKAVPKNCSVTVYTDSSYVANAFEKHWIDSWKCRNWVKSDGTGVLNRELWEQLLSVMAKHKEVNFVWVKGHAGNRYNELCDKLAVEAIRHLKK